MITDDGHDPSTCNYQVCGASSKWLTPCPFLKDEKPASTPEEARGMVEARCEHEWRQYWTTGEDLEGNARVLPVGFFCIHCKNVEL